MRAVVTLLFILLHMVKCSGDFQFCGLGLFRDDHDNVVCWKHYMAMLGGYGPPIPILPFNRSNV